MYMKFLTFIYYYDLKSNLTRKILKKYCYINYEKYKNKKIDWKFSFASKIGYLVILITKYGVISVKESALTNEKKRKSSLEARKFQLEE